MGLNANLGVAGGGTIEECVPSINRHRADADSKAMLKTEGRMRAGSIGQSHVPTCWC